MGLLDKLQDKGSVLSNINGTQPTKSNLSTSTVHPAVSTLDLDGVKPKAALSDPRYLSDKPLSFKKGTYIDNLPK